MSDLIPENQVSEKQDIPSVTVGDVIHSCGTDNFCVATIVSGIFANFEDKGMIVVTVAFAFWWNASSMQQHSCFVS